VKSSPAAFERLPASKRRLLFGVLTTALTAGCLLLDPFDDLAHEHSTAPADAAATDDAPNEAAAVQLGACNGQDACAPDDSFALAMGDGLAQVAEDVAVDASGNIYVVGAFAGDLTLPGGTSLVQSGAVSISDAYIVKLTHAGKLVWARSVPDGEFQSVAVSANGVVASGAASAATSAAECGPIAYQGSADALVVRWSADGQCVKARSFGDAQGQVAAHVAVDRNTNEILIAGNFTGTLAFGGPPDAGTSFSAGAGSAAFLARLDAQLDGVNAQRIAPSDLTSVPGYIYLFDLAVDRFGDALVVGVYAGLLELMASKGSRDAFLLEYDPRGLRTKRFRFGEKGVTRARTVAFDDAMNVYVSGTFADSIDLTAAGGPILQATAPNTDMFVWRAPFQRGTTDINNLVAKSFPGPGIQTPYAIAADVAGNVVVVGDTGDPDAGYDAFMSKHDHDLNPIWSVTFGDTNTYQGAFGVAIDTSILVTGWFSGSVDFLGHGQRLSAAGPGSRNGDAFLLRRPP